MTLRNPESIHPWTLPNRKSSYRNSEEERADRQTAVEAQLPVWRALLPGLMEKFSRIADPRRPGSIRHKLTVLLTFGLFMFIFQYASRRRANRELTRPTFWEHFREIFPEVETIPHMDTVQRILERINPGELEEVMTATVKRLLRSGRLKALLVEKQYVIAIDGTQKASRGQPWASEALHRRHGENQASSMAYALEASLVSPQGVVLPFLTEFCENAAEQQEFEKQDSELKACKRLLTRLRKMFPKLRILVVADGLYPNGPMMALCRDLHLDFMFVLPQSCLPSVWEEVKGLRKIEPNERRHRWGNREQIFWWINQIDYDFREASGAHRRLKVHVVGCTEFWEEGGKQQEAHWAWVSGQPLTAQNVVNRCNRAARHRWDIEEQILTEKHRGYEYEHLYSTDWTAMRNWHVLMHLGHLVNVMALHTEGLMKKVRELGFSGTLKFLYESWTQGWMDRDWLLARCQGPPRLTMAF